MNKYYFFKRNSKSNSCSASFALKAISFFLALIIITYLPVITAYGVEALPDRLVPGGMAFGVKFFTKGVIVVGISDVQTPKGLVSPAEDAGLIVGDIILKVNGNEVNTADEFGEAIKYSNGKSVTLLLDRDGENETAELVPALSADDNVYRAGVWIRDSTAGIGTVTFIDAETNFFGGLGHGICDVDTGMLMPMKKAVIVKVDVDEIIKGKPDDPGEIKGDFSSVAEGELYKNTENGVFGYFDVIPGNLGKPLNVAKKRDVKEGKAYIYCTLDKNGPQKYDIKIEKILSSSGPNKNFIIKVTDKNLLDKTGGIIQGMSGSPIIQNDKIVGAVTHVFVNEPEKGYGIFIENMLKSSD